MPSPDKVADFNLQGRRTALYAELFSIAAVLHNQRPQEMPFLFKPA
jgi:hypothetical protein